MKNIVLIGMMGSAKSTVGRQLNKITNMQLYDSDDCYEKIYNETISTTFSNLGEQVFRDRESQVIKDLAKKEGIIIACGGGVILREENMLELKRNGIIYFLNPTIEEIYRRVSHNTSRPLLENNTMEKVSEIFDSRKDAYEKFADLTIDNTTLSPFNTANQIFNHYKLNNI